MKLSSEIGENHPIFLFPRKEYAKDMICHLKSGPWAIFIIVIWCCFSLSCLSDILVKAFCISFAVTGELGRYCQISSVVNPGNVDTWIFSIALSKIAVVGEKKAR